MTSMIVRILLDLNESLFLLESVVHVYPVESFILSLSLLLISGSRSQICRRDLQCINWFASACPCLVLDLFGPSPVAGDLFC
jgi:hypothetical protein